MSSLPNSPAVTEWFQRLEAAWRLMPAEERTRQHAEVRQHLEALAAANEELGSTPGEAWQLALTQFGDPGRFGKKMVQEWQQSQSSFNADMKAIWFGLSLQILSIFSFQLMNNLWIKRLFDPHDMLYTHGQGVTGFAWMVSLSLSYSEALILSIVIGRKYPFQAIKSSLYSNLIRLCWELVPIFVAFSRPNTSVTPGLSWLIVWSLWNLMFGCGAAYLASVTKRGWYRPSLADFKITLPSRTKQISR